MPATKPTFVLVPGAFHSPACFQQVFDELHSAGYETKSGTLTSVNDASKTTSDDIAFVREKLLLPLINEGKDVIVAPHSYAGMPVGSAIEGLSKVERAAKGQQGGVVGLIYICAFVSQEGASLFDMIGGKWAPWQDVKEDTGLITTLDPMNTFYGDVPDDIAANAIANLGLQSIKSFTSPAPKPAYTEKAYDGLRAYVRTEKDGALPAFVQDLMVDGSKVEWDVKRFDTSHSPFLSVPKDFAAMLVSVAEVFAETVSGKI